VLQIASSGGNIVLSWSDLWDGFQVQTCTDFATPESWAPVGVSPALNNGRFTVSDALPEGHPCGTGGLFCGTTAGSAGQS